MLEHQHSLPQTLPDSESAYPQVSNTPEESKPGEARIEDYLDHVCAQLVGIVPYAKRMRVRAEMRLHLDAMVVAHEELGGGNEESVEAVLRQFGSPNMLSQRWLDEWVQEALPVVPKSVWPATKVALHWYAKMLAVPLLALCLAVAFQEKTHLGRALDPLVGILLAVFYAFPLLGGFAVGLNTPSRPMRATINALAILIPPAVGIGELLVTWADPSRHFWIETGAVTGISFAIFMPVCCGMAALGRRWRRKQVLKPRQWASS